MNDGRNALPAYDEAHSAETHPAPCNIRVAPPIDHPGTLN